MTRSQTRYPSVVAFSNPMWKPPARRPCGVASARRSCGVASATTHAVMSLCWHPLHGGEL